MTAGSASVHQTDLPIVVLSTADISAPIWTNKQHIATRLTSYGEVHYIESLGLRSPTLNIKDIKRIITRLVSIIYKKDNLNNYVAYDKSSLIIHSPIVIPFHGSAFARWINERIISIGLRRKLPSRYVLWTFSPLTYGLEKNAEKVFYHSVDLLHTFPNVPQAALLNAERKTIGLSNAIIASSKGVVEHLRRQGADPYLWENVADIDLFESYQSEERIPRAIFVGNLTASKVDFTLLESLAQKGIQIALAGPTSIDGTKQDSGLGILLTYPSVTYLGVLSQKDMAIELGRSWVGIIPYICNDYTAGVFPMKVYEYLAAGLNVIATPLQSLVDAEVEGLTVTHADNFVAETRRICEEPYTPPNGSYKSNSWDARVVQITQLISADGK